MADSSGAVAAVPAAAGVVASEPGMCRACDGALGAGYFRVNGREVCAGCHRQLAGSGVQAVLGGVLAATLSVGLYYGVLAVLDVRFSLVAVLAGVMVGAAVRRARGYRVSMPYRLLALALTYLAVVTTYTHAVLELPGVTSPWVAWMGSWLLPFRMAVEGKNIVSLVLLVFGLHEAWQFSAPPIANVEGPLPAPDSQ